MLNQLKTIVLLGALSALIVGLGALFAPSYLLLFALIAVALNVGAYFYSDRLVLRMHDAQELAPSRAPELYGMVAELAARAGIPTPRLFLIDSPQPNAFATGRNPEHGVVAVTRGIVELLSPRELRGVVAHEIAHIKHRDILVSTIAAVLGSLVTSAAHALSFLSIFGSSEDEEGGAAGGLLVALVAPIAATLIQLGISRSREYLADEAGARLSGDPEALASALVKLERGVEYFPSDARPATASLFIVNPLFDRGSLSSWFSTHPATEERVRRLLALAERAPTRSPRRMGTPRLVRRAW